MAGFCKQCCITRFGEDFQDLSGITKQKDWKVGDPTIVMCEGCGEIYVDPEGNCASTTCSCHGQPGHGVPWPNDICVKTPAYAENHSE